MISLCQDRGELIHESTWYAGVIVLGLLAKKCFLHWIQFVASDRFKERSRGDFKGRAARQPAAVWQRRLDDCIEPSDALPSFLKTRDDASDVVRPGGFTTLDLLA